MCNRGLEALPRGCERPVAYLPVERLADYWKLEELKPGTTDFYQFADLAPIRTYHDEKPRTYEQANCLSFQLGMLGFRLPQDRQIGIGIFPQCEEILRLLFGLR